MPCVERRDKMIWRIIVWWFDTFCRCAQCAPNYENIMVPHHKYVINLHVRIDNVTEYVLCYWNSKDIPINSCFIYNYYCNKPFTCDGLNFVIWGKGGSRDCDICLAQGILICSDCQGKFFCSDFCGIFHNTHLEKTTNLPQFMTDWSALMKKDDGSLPRSSK